MDTTELLKKISCSIEEDPIKGNYRLRRDVFTDSELFELEMKHIFEGNWVYVAHESQVPNPNDFYTTFIGRQPVIVARNKDGELNAFINSCSHRGATLCRTRKGNKSTYSCPFHGWTFNSSGKLIKVKDDGPEAGYPDSFNKNGSHDLKKLPKFESYRGFLFASLNADVKPLEQHLGEATKFLDLLVDQAPEGFEVLHGASTYVFDGNWKIQAENGVDGYHVTATHWNYVATTNRRKAGQSQDSVKAMDASSFSKQPGGFYGFENGHISVFSQWPNPNDRPIAERREELTRSFGADRASIMIGYLRNLCLYPNVFIMDQFSSQIRVFRPLAVDKTEVTIYCLAPKGESAEMRSHRLRQYEDFFNASGMATPDDLEEFRACQEGFNGDLLIWNDMSRGAKHWIHGPDENARMLGMNPVMSGVRVEDEGLYPVQHHYWAAILTRAIEQEARSSGGDK